MLRSLAPFCIARRNGHGDAARGQSSSSPSTFSRAISPRKARPRSPRDRERVSPRSTATTTTISRARPTCRARVRAAARGCRGERVRVRRARGRDWTFPAAAKEGRRVPSRSRSGTNQQRPDASETTRENNIAFFVLKTPGYGPTTLTHSPPLSYPPLPPLRLLQRGRRPPPRRFPPPLRLSLLRRFPRRRPRLRLLLLDVAPRPLRVVPYERTSGWS